MVLGNKYRIFRLTWGGYKQVPQIYVNVNGTWKPLFSFSWEQGSWSECSAECGGGTQQRTVRCKRNDGTYWPDSVCSSVGTKPETTQSCNTQSCAECHFIEGPNHGFCGGSSNFNHDDVYVWIEFGKKNAAAYRTGPHVGGHTPCGDVPDGTKSCVGNDGITYYRGEYECTYSGTGDTFYHVCY